LLPRVKADRRNNQGAETGGEGMATGQEMLSSRLGVLRAVGSEADVSSTVEAFLPDSQERFFEENSYLAERMALVASLSIDGTDLGLTGGFLWRISELWKVGGFFRQGPQLSIEIETRAGPADLFGVPAGALLGAVASPMDLPDVYGMGVTFQSADGRFAASFEWDRVEYATILTSLAFDPGTGLDDGDELHIGAEYVFLEATPVTALRLGAWLDPDHRSKATTEDPVDRAFFPEGDDELHLAFGLGLALRRVQLDIAADFSDSVDTLSLSTIYSF
jgi:hypothetical protein